MSNRRHPFFTEEWHDTREFVLERDDGKCQECGVEEEIMHVHHVIPRREGGPDAPENLVTLCQSCHGIIEAEYRKNRRTV